MARLKPGPLTRTGKLVRVLGTPERWTWSVPVLTPSGKAVTRP
jgi:hypothetical protein